MSLIAARKKRTTLYLSVAGLMVMVAAVSGISAVDPNGVSLRVGMIMVAVGAALWLPWRQLVPAVVLAWLLPNLGRSIVDESFTLPNVHMALELAGLAGVAFFTTMARDALRNLEQENLLLGSGSSDLAGLNTETGIFDESQLRPTLEGELARSRRFGRTFSLVLVGIDEMRQKFDYRDDVTLRLSLDATAKLLRQTRHNVDRVFHYRNDGFAIILPESTDKDIPGLVKRLRRLARGMKPAEGEPGGPMPVHFGATFFPDCATTVDDMLRRAEVALRIAASNTTRYQQDSAEAPEMPPGETLRRESVEAAPATSTAETPRPPMVTNPIAAAIVDEAYAERSRDAFLETKPDLRVVALNEAEPAGEPAMAAEEAATATYAQEPSEAREQVPALQMMEPVEEATPIQATGLPDLPAEVSMASEQAARPLPVEVVDPVAKGPLDADLPPDFASAPALASLEQTEEPAATAIVEVTALASETEPVAVTAGPDGASHPQSVGQPLSEPVQAASEVADDFEALLRQMDETLKMIKSVRSSAA